MLNKVILIGNLGADPEPRFTQSGVQVTTFSLATTERWKDQNGQQQAVTEWHRIVAWRRLAEICTQYLHKGSKVYIEGKLQTRKWQDQNGVDRYTTEIVANEMKMLDSKQSEQPGNTQAQAMPEGQRPTQQSMLNGHGEQHNHNPPGYDEDLPF